MSEMVRVVPDGDGGWIRWPRQDGGRLVPVELWRAYTEAQERMEKTSMAIAEYLDRHPATDIFRDYR